jgi:hypothetical protein
MYIEGINPNTTYLSGVLESPVPFALGTRGLDQLGNEYVFGQAVAASTNGGVCFYVPGVWTMTLLSTANDAVDQFIAVAKATLVINEYGWFQRYGPCPVQTSGATAIQLPVLATAAAGVVTTSATLTGLFPIRGMVALQTGQVLPLLTNYGLTYPLAAPVVAIA